MKHKPLLKPISHRFWHDCNLSKHIPVAFATFLQWERVLTNCNHAKSDVNVVSTKTFASFQQNHFQLFLVLVGLLRKLTHSTWQLHLLFIIIQAVKRETNQYFVTGTCFDKL